MVHATSLPHLPLDYFLALVLEHVVKDVVIAFYGLGSGLDRSGGRELDFLQVTLRLPEGLMTLVHLLVEVGSLLSLFKLFGCFNIVFLLLCRIHFENTPLEGGQLRLVVILILLLAHHLILAEEVHLLQHQPLIGLLLLILLAALLSLLPDLLCQVAIVGLFLLVSTLDEGDLIKEQLAHIYLIATLFQCILFHFKFVKFHLLVSNLAEVVISARLESLLHLFGQARPLSHQLSKGRLVREWLLLRENLFFLCDQEGIVWLVYN